MYKGEKIAITKYSEFKKALLLFDKVFVPPEIENKLPVSIKEFSFYEKYKLPNEYKSKKYRKSIHPILGDYTYEKLEEFEAITLQKLIEDNQDSVFDSLIELDLFKRYSLYFQNKGFNIIPLYAQLDHFKRDFPIGDFVAYQAVLESIPIIDSNQIEWDQIVQIRGDKSSIQKIRDLRLWLENGLNKSSIQQAEDHINQKLEDYTKALHKHGLKTLIGAFRTIINWKTSAAALAAGTLANNLGGPIWASISSGVIIAGEITAYIVEQKIKVDDIKQGANREIAYINDLKDKFT